MKRLLLLYLAIAPLTLCAQPKAKAFRYIEDIIPEGWICASNNGDMNNDGIEDIAAIFYPPAKELNPILAIYWGGENGTFKLWNQFDNTLPGQEYEYAIPEYSVEVTKKGILKLNHSIFHSAGGWAHTQHTELFRYQDGDFYLIGSDENTIIRNTGDVEEVSINYLTGKQKTRQYNATNERRKAKETWTNIQKKPLKPLSEWKLE